MHGVKVREDGPHKNLRFDPQRDSVFIVGHPDSRSAEFTVWLQFEVFAKAFQLNIELDRVVTSRMDRYSFVAQHSHSGQIRGSGRIDDDSIDSVIIERLTSQVKDRAVKIKQAGKIEWFRLGVV